MEPQPTQQPVDILAGCRKHGVGDHPEIWRDHRPSAGGLVEDEVGNMTSAPAHPPTGGEIHDDGFRRSRTGRLVDYQVEEVLRARSVPVCAEPFPDRLRRRPRPHQCRSQPVRSAARTSKSSGIVESPARWPPRCPAGSSTRPAKRRTQHRPGGPVRRWRVPLPRRFSRAVRRTRRVLDPRHRPRPPGCRPEGGPHSRTRGRHRRSGRSRWRPARWR